MRRVSIHKVIQEAGSKPKLSKAYTGWEEIPPKVGERYAVYGESGRIFKTSPVVKVSGDFFKTQNSVYKLTVLETEPFDLRGDDQTTQERLI